MNAPHATYATYATQSCEAVAEQAESYLDGSLDNGALRLLEAHLEQCASCREQMQSFREVHGLMEFSPLKPVGAERDASAELAFESVTARVSIKERLAAGLGGAPWWLVSLSLHALLIALAALVSMAIELPHGDDSVIMVTELQARPEIKAEDEKTKPEAALDSKPATAATDPTSKESSDIVIPPDILAKAELGDHFETINPDRPDTHSAFGVEEARSFHAVTGNAEAAGGGGAGGLGLDDIIGAGGAASKGKGGCFGGGDGSGVGANSGAGKGSFGSRNGGGRKLMVKKHGGTKETEGAVDRGLEWLARNQEADGHWDTVKHGSAPGKADAEELDVGMTSLAMLCFLGAGHTERVGKYKDNVVKAVNWLKSKQTADGCYGPARTYSHSMATMAMAEAAGMARNAETMASAQKGVDWMTNVGAKDDSSERGGWDYMGKQKNDIGNCDISNTGWAMMSLKSAKVAGLKVSPFAIEGLMKSLNSCEVDKVAGDPYSGHHYVYYPINMIKTDPQATRTAIGITGSIFFGTPASDCEQAMRKYCFEAPGAMIAPRTDGKWFSIDMYYVYYATLGSFQIGGDIWRDWNKALVATLPPLQIKGGADDGSWDPKESQYIEHQSLWGRMGETTLAILCMEVYYRYHQLSDPAKKN